MQDSILAYERLCFHAYHVLGAECHKYTCAEPVQRADGCCAGLRFSERHSYCKYTPDPNKAVSGADMSWLYQDSNCIFSLERCYWALLVQAVGWMLAAVYFDNVQPNRHGVRLPYYYPLMPSYWINMFRSGSATSDSSKHHAVSRTGSLVGTKQHSPFAAPDAARKVARAISGVKVDEEVVIRCTSSAGGAGGHDATAARGLDGVATQGSMASTTRHSVSSGMLRRRDNRNSGSGAVENAPAAGCESVATELVTMPSRSQLMGSTMGRAQLSGRQHSTHLLINPSVTVLRLSDASSDAAHVGGAHVSTATGAASGAAAAGTTITLQQYQQWQADSKQRSAASKRWWEFWRVGEDSLTISSKKHDSMVAAAAAAAAPSASAALQNSQAVGQYGVTPVVLDAGVLQEEQRMKAALFGGKVTPSSLLWLCTSLATVHCSHRPCLHVPLPLYAYTLLHLCGLLAEMMGSHTLLLQSPRAFGATSRTCYKCLACTRFTSSQADASGGSSGVASSPSSRRRSSTWLLWTAGLACRRASSCAYLGPTVLARPPASTA